MRNLFQHFLQRVQNIFERSSKIVTNERKFDKRVSKNSFLHATNAKKQGKLDIISPVCVYLRFTRGDKAAGHPTAEPHHRT